MSDNPYSPPQPIVAIADPVQDSPPLWNPNAAIAWSLLLSPIFGATLHMKNWQALGKKEEAAGAKAWVIGLCVVYAAIFTALIVLPETSVINRFANLIGLVIMITWYAGGARDQVQFVTFGYGKAYVRRSWLAPFLWVLAVVAALMVLGFVVAMLGDF